MIFEEMYLDNLSVLQRFVHSRVSNLHDAQDIIQTVSMAALKGFPALSDPARFRTWLLSIAANKIKDYYSDQKRRHNVSLESLPEGRFLSEYDRDLTLDVRRAIDSLPDHERQIFRLYYFKGLPQKDIAAALKIPIGTVKSRMYAGKHHFMQHYRRDDERKVSIMKNAKFPSTGPEYEIISSTLPPFEVVCQEVPGWLIVPKVGERMSMAFYDDPNRVLTSVSTMTCTRRASIHGVDCVQIDITDEEDGKSDNRSIFVRLTEERCLYVAEMRMQDGMIHFSSFLDSEWCSRYSIGENNIGRDIRQSVRGEARWQSDNTMTVSENILKREECDLIGRFTVRINGNNHDTVAMVCIEGGDMMVIQHIDIRGRTVLFRRFNRADWKQEKYGDWTQKLPDSERMLVNGQVFVHWYDCIPDWVF